LSTLFISSADKLDVCMIIVLW